MLLLVASLVRGVAIVSVMIHDREYRAASDFAVLWQVKEPKRPSSGFARSTGGRFANVGGPRGDGGLWKDQYRRPDAIFGE